MLTSDDNQLMLIDSSSDHWVRLGDVLQVAAEMAGGLRRQ